MRKRSSVVNYTLCTRSRFSYFHIGTLNLAFLKGTARRPPNMPLASRQTKDRGTLRGIPRTFRSCCSWRQQPLPFLALAFPFCLLLCLARARPLTVGTCKSGKQPHVGIGSDGRPTYAEGPFEIELWHILYGALVKTERATLTFVFILIISRIAVRGVGVCRRMCVCFGVGADGV
jgi:hypothetical protein